MSYKINKLTLLSGGLFILTSISALFLSSPLALADNSATNDIQITVPVSCNLSSSTTTNHTATVDAGTYRNDIGESTITATCNDAGGFAIYAIGYSNEEYGNNTLVNTTNSTQTIATGTATSGPTSNWAMKLTAVDGTYTPTIVGSTLDSEKEQSTPDFSNYIDVPSTYTKVAYRNSNTDQSTGANFKSTYAAYIAPTQYAGTYEGKVKYTLVHPTNHAAPIIPAYLDTGQNVNSKMMSLAATVVNGEETTITPEYFIYDETASPDEYIKSIDVHLNTAVPTGFISSEANTISSSTSQKPIYIVFDNTNDAGIMNFYTEGDQIVLSSDSSHMFYLLSALEDLSDISSWDTSGVTNMKGMFQNAGNSAVTFSLDLSSWDTSNVTDMSWMFYGAGGYVPTFSLDLSDWDTSSVTDMGYMFDHTGSSASNFSLDISSWDTSGVTYMLRMFYDAGRSATTWTTTIPQTNGNGISNTTSYLYGSNTSAYATPPSGKSFTLAQ